MFPHPLGIESGIFLNVGNAMWAAVILGIKKILIMIHRRVHVRIRKAFQLSFCFLKNILPWHSQEKCVFLSYWFEERTSTCSTYLCIHWLFLVCTWLGINPATSANWDDALHTTELPGQGLHFNYLNIYNVSFEVLLFVLLLNFRKYV